MIKAVIFDLNGVFIKSPKFSLRFKEKYGIVEEEFLPVLKETLGVLRLPNSPSAYSLWEPYLKKWDINLNEKGFLDFWYGVEKEDPEMFALAKELKGKGIKVIILSNNFKERTNYYQERFPNLQTTVDKISYSWQTGFLKSSVRAYNELLRETGLQANECLFFDDSKANVALANSVGIQAFIHENLEETKGIIEEKLKSAY